MDRQEKAVEFAAQYYGGIKPHKNLVFPAALFKYLPLTDKVDWDDAMDAVKKAYNLGYSRGENNED